MERGNPSDWNDVAKPHNELTPDRSYIGNLVNGDWTDQSRRELHSLQRCIDEVGRCQCPSGQRCSHPSFQQGEVAKAGVVWYALWDAGVPPVP
jgi:hypothetical protein